MPRNHLRRMTELSTTVKTINNQLNLSKNTLNNLKVKLDGNCNTFVKDMWLSRIRFSRNFDLHF